MSNAEDQEITLAMIRERLYSAVISDALDSVGLTSQSPRVSLLPITGVNKLVGRCKTTLWADMWHKDPRPYALELQAVDTCRPDEILICAAGGSMRSGIWGELLSTAARNSGCTGVIVDGAVRDVAKMTEMGFPVFARGTSLYDSLDRQRVIDLDVTVQIDCTSFSPGDLVFADVDGIVVVPRAVETIVIQKAWKKVHAEDKTREQIRGGMKATEVFAKYGIL
jgi:regulator of RNase E activity RraA